MSYETVNPFDIMKKYSVKIFDDELRIPMWRNVIFSVDKQVDDESYRALGGCNLAQPIKRISTESKEEAIKKMREMKHNGWKTKIVEE